MAVRLGLRGYSLDAGLVDPAFASAGTDYTAQVVAQKIASFTLGVSPVSPLELANVGATIDSDGKWCPPTPDRHHHRPRRQVRHLGQDALRSGRPAGAGAHPRCRHGGRPDRRRHRRGRPRRAAGWSWTAAGKTGTTQEYKSSAFLGFTPEMSASVILWDSEPRPQSICRDPIRTCATEEALAGNGMSGGSVPAATWMGR